MRYQISPQAADQRHCLQCGDPIEYGRTDKKFCSSQCRYRYWNHRSKDFRAYHVHVLNVIERNYRILERLLRMEITSMDIMEMLRMGFRPEVATMIHLPAGRGKARYYLYEIRYYVSHNRIYGIERIQTMPQPDTAEAL